MPLIEVSGLILGQCAKPGCLRRTIQRHHMGCERMWLRHFYPKRRSKKYRDFRNRYNKFLAEDTVKICAHHHEEIHVLYMPTIRMYSRKLGYPANWTWKQVEELISVLRKECAEWLLKETPGLTPTKR